MALAKQIRYKDGTILTDGKGLIRIGYVRKRDWTPENNYGNKWDEYINCTHYPKSEPNDPKGYYLNNEMIYSGSPGRLPGMWLQVGEGLNKFKPINEKFIHPDILKYLKQIK